MAKINSDVRDVRTVDDMPVTEFWEHRYLPYCEKERKGTGMRGSNVRGFKQVWR
jgi:hypothetical protein